ncbi:DUF7832 domain-containing protein [Christensenella intestinihominis]|uniref:DUF7832 domain-containing protein n=1 Tax=Christensenella intestinihominis TaxID=1851429 RepID=UPI000835F4C6|nr:hypothetical protein [Christensenella intestinihominis]
MAFDKMDWHAVTFPDSIPYENAGTHIGMYLAWLVNNDLIQEDWLEEFADAFDRVRSREMTGRDLLMECFDETLMEDLMVEEALEFTGEYYDSSYIDDFVDALANEGVDSEFAVYLHEDTWENYDRLEPVINEKFEKWRNQELD